MAKCKTCGYNSGKKNHSCALQLKRKMRAAIAIFQQIEVDGSADIGIEQLCATGIECLNVAIELQHTKL